MKKGKGRPELEKIELIPLGRIIRPEIAVRTSMSRERLETLMNSIKRVGLIQPIVLKTVGKKYEIVVGERRFVAFETLKRGAIPARVISGDVAKSAEVWKLHENLEREEVNALDEARFISRINKQLGLSQKDIASHIGRSEGYVSQRLAIMSAPAIIQEALEDGVISFSVARELSLIDDAGELKQMVHYAAQNGITPNVAKSWRLQYEARVAQIGPTETLPPISGNLPSAPQNTSFVCDACRNKTEINRMKILRVCPKCEQTFSNADVLVPGDG